MRFLRDTILNQADASVDQISIFLDTSYMAAISAQMVITGTAHGIVTFEASNDYAFLPPNTQSPVNWNTVANTTICVDGAGSFLIPKIDVCYQWMRAKYTFTSGTGTITINTKGIGF